MDRLDARPDLSQAWYALELSHDELCELIAGRVPHAVLVACLSGVKALTETPAEGLASMTQRKRRRTEAA